MYTYIYIYIYEEKCYKKNYKVVELDGGGFDKICSMNFL